MVAFALMVFLPWRRVFHAWAGSLGQYACAHSMWLRRNRIEQLGVIRALGLDACVLFLQHAPCLVRMRVPAVVASGGTRAGCETPGPRPACSQSGIPARQVVPKCRVAVPGRAVQHGEGSRVPPRG